MAVAFDAHSVSGAAPAVDPSWTHAPVGTPRGALVYVISPTSDPVVGVTYGGTAMTNVANFVESAGGEWSGYQWTAFFLGASVPSGGQTVAVDAGALDVFAYAYTVTAAADTEYIANATAQSASSTSITATLSLGGRTCFACEAFGSGADAATGVDPLTSWTARAENDFGTFAAGSYSYDTVGSTDVTVGLSHGVAEDAFVLAIAVSEIVAGANPKGPLGMMIFGPLQRVVGP